MSSKFLGIMGEVNRDVLARIPSIWKNMVGEVRLSENGEILIDSVSLKVSINGDESHGIYSDGQERWYKGNRLHRTDGPAVTTTSGKQYYFVNGMQMDEDEYFKHFGDD